MVRSRSPNGINVYRFLEGYGVRILPYAEKRAPRPANVLYGGRTVARLLRKDADRTGLTVRCIQASDPACFDSVYLIAVYRFLQVHFAHREAREAISAFSLINLPLTRQRAQRLCQGEGGSLAKMTAALALELAHQILTEDKAA